MDQRCERLAQKRWAAGRKSPRCPPILTSFVDDERIHVVAGIDRIKSGRVELVT
jgi:hypothetical protein